MALIRSTCSTQSVDTITNYNTNGLSITIHILATFRKEKLTYLCNN